MIISSPIPFQFDKLVIKPLHSITPHQRPVVIILDALDECGTAEDWAILLDVLAKQSSSLPLECRIIVVRYRRVQYLHSLILHLSPLLQTLPNLDVPDSDASYIQHICVLPSLSSPESELRVST